MRRTVTLAGVLVAGIAAALVVASLQRESMRDRAVLEGIVDPDPTVRAEAWSMMDATFDRSKVLPRLLRHHEDTEILADAAIEFDRLGWKADPILVVAAARLGDPGPLVLALDSGALDEPRTRWELMTGLASVLADRGLEPSGLQIHDRVMESCLESIPPSEHPVLMEAMLLEGAETAARDRLLLAFALLGTPPGDGFAEGSITALATAMANGRLPSDPSLIERLPAWTLIHPALGGEGGSELTRRIDRDDAEARRTLGVLDRARHLDRAEAVLADRTTTFERRALAANRLLEHDRSPGDASILNLLQAGPEDTDGSVHAAACIAWLGLSDTGRAGLEDRWWRSDDEAEIRAAILLTALRHRDGSLPSEAPAIQEIDRLSRDADATPRVRRTARLAARAMQRWPFEMDDLDAEIYASRTRRFEDGRVDPDSMLLGLVAEDPVADRLLVTQPASPIADAPTFAREIAWRRTLAGHLRPEWIDITGEPIPGDEEALRLWVDLLAAARLVDRFAQPASSGEDLPR